MYYSVIKPFKNLDGSFLQIGDKIDCDFHRAAILRRNGLIGNIAESKPGINPEMNKPIETAEEKPTKRKYRKRNQQETESDD